MMHRGEVYYADLFGAVGSEQAGIRPVVILQNEKGNRFSKTVIVAPISSQLDKPPLPTHVKIPNVMLERASIILLEQLRTIDKQRMGQWICTLDEELMEVVNEALKVSLDIK